MKNYEITMDSFGSECPANWEEIADYLNGIINGWIEELTTVDEDGAEELDEETLSERVNNLWETYCAGELEGAPAPVSMTAKTIWIARIADDNSDAYKAFFTEPEAAAQAAEYATHLTANERKTQTVSVESYPVEVHSDDDRTAEQLYRDLVNEDDAQIMNPDTYEEL